MVEFGSDVWFRPMDSADIAAVMRIIEDYDEDDAEDARQTFEGDLLGYFVYGHGKTVTGVTGATPIEGTNDSYILGWTHTAEDRPGTEYRDMVGELTQRLAEEGGRKLFAAVSDYIDPEDGDIGAPLRRALTDLGFIEELRHQHFYDHQESQVIFGLRLREPDYQNHAPDHREIRLTDIDEIEETHDAYWLSWELSDDALPLNREDFQKITDQVIQWEGRVIFIGFPGGIPAVDRLMQNAGYRFDGRLSDFYDDGVDDLRYRMDL